ncbi:hypothetical protein M9Y10_022402 [Tritrichomonas musculus]|uniref:G domain-containing protein n=1 Tax=Tritrichomonas musculus TaxID=1915356 RepID=A0ABR2KU48_9EUKA
MSSRLHKTTIEEISEKIEKTDSTIKQNFLQHDCKHRLILIGTTGNGKSTLSNLIIGRNLLVSKNDIEDIILTSEEEIFPMGDDFNSKTTVPNIIYDRVRNVLICDPPGFNDSRKSKQDIINSFATNELFSSPCKISILLVISGNETDVSGGRGKDFIANLQYLTDMIPNEEELKQCLGLVISKPKKSIKVSLESFIKRSSSDLAKRMCQFFLDEIDRRTFSFPEPSEDEIGQEYNFADKEKIYRFLNECYVENPHHKVILNDESLGYLIKIIQAIPKIENIIYDLTGKIEEAFSIEQNEEELSGWENFRNKLLERDNSKTIDAFMRTIQTHIVHPEQYEDIIHQIQYLKSIFEFIGKVEQLSKMDIKFDIDKNINSLTKQLTSLIKIKKDEQLLKEMNRNNRELRERITQVENESQENLLLYQEQSSQLQEKIRESEEKIKDMKLQYDEQKENYENYIAEVQENNKGVIEQMQQKLDSYSQKDSELPLDKMLSIVDSGLKFALKLMGSDDDS